MKSYVSVGCDGRVRPEPDLASQPATGLPATSSIDSVLSVVTPAFLLVTTRTCLQILSVEQNETVPFGEIHDLSQLFKRNYIYIVDMDSTLEDGFFRVSLQKRARDMF